MSTFLYVLLFLQCDKIKELIAKLRETLGKKDDTDPEDLKKQTNELQQASLKLFEMAYKKVLMKINLISAIIILCVHLSECYILEHACTFTDGCGKRKQSIAKSVTKSVTTRI